MHRIWLAVLLLVCGHVAAAGQDPIRTRALPGSAMSSDSLPRGLVAALLGIVVGRTATVADIRVDQPGVGLPGGLLDGGRVLGSAVIGTNMTTVAYMPGTPGVVFDTIRARLEANGWRRAPRPREERGFITAYPIDPSDRFCRGSEMLTPLVTVQTLERSLLVLSHQRMAGMPLCTEVPVRPSGRVLEETPLPALRPPPGTRSTGGGASAGSDGWQVHTHLTGSIPLIDVLRHYDNQFQAAGWTKREEMTSAGLVVAAFTYDSADGEKWYCALLATRAPGASDAGLTLQLRRM